MQLTQEIDYQELLTEQQRRESLEQLEADMFGHPAEHRPARIRPHTEIFRIENELSSGERLQVSTAMAGIAGQLVLDGQERQARKVVLECQRYELCGQKLFFRCPNDETRFFVPNHCHSRICETCGRIYRKEIERQIIPLLREVTDHKRRGFCLSLLTLTVTSRRFESRLPSTGEINTFQRQSAKLLKLFFGKYKAVLKPDNTIHEPAPRWIYKTDTEGKRRKVRRRVPEVKAGKGGKESEDYRIYRGAGFIACIELGPGNNNLHLHAITYGPIIPWQQIRSAWERITGDSWQTDIRAAKGDLKTIASYILKYITKPPVHDSYYEIATYALMIKGVRRIRSGGIFYHRLKKIKRISSGLNRCPYCQARLILEGLDDQNAVALPLRELHRQLEKTGHIPSPGELHPSLAIVCPF